MTRIRFEVGSKLDGPWAGITQNTKVKDSTPFLSKTYVAADVKGNVSLPNALFLGPHVTSIPTGFSDSSMDWAAGTPAQEKWPCGNVTLYLTDRALNAGV